MFEATLSYEAWRRRHFSNDELAHVALSGDDSDPDGDGVSNLVEYAAGADPRIPSFQPWVWIRRVVAGNSSSITLEYRRRPLGHAVHYAVEISSDLVTWEAPAATTTEQLQADGMVLVSLVEASALPNPAVRFYRVKVTKAHPEF